MPTVERIIQRAAKKFQTLNLEMPQLDAEVILCNILGVDRIKLHIYPNLSISRENCRKFWLDVKKRVNYMPVQYIIKRQEFMGLDFFVEEGVLIPRADTELLVEESINICKEIFFEVPVKVLEIGTGSGAISVSLAKYFDELEIKAVDISEEALKIAKKNAITHKVQDKIEFLQGDIFTPIKNKKAGKKFHMIVSNPPYISNDDVENLIMQVKGYEPLIALRSGEDGLDFYRTIINQAPEFLEYEGRLLLEIGYNQGEQVSRLMNERGFKNITVKKDLAGLNRLVVGEWQNDVKCDNIVDALNENR